jgi:hypothetical protein
MEESKSKPIFKYLKQSSYPSTEPALPLKWNTQKNWKKKENYLIWRRRPRPSLFSTHGRTLCQSRERMTDTVLIRETEGSIIPRPITPLQNSIIWIYNKSSNIWFIYIFRTCSALAWQIQPRWSGWNSAPLNASDRNMWNTKPTWLFF